MNTKDLSPAFLTSLAGIFVGAILIGMASTAATVIGWLLLLAGLALNVFSALVSLQRLKGGPLPAIIAEEDSEAGFFEDDEPVTGSIDEVDELSADTDQHRVVAGQQAADDKIFRSRAPRPRNR